MGVSGDYKEVRGMQELEFDRQGNGEERICSVRARSEVEIPSSSSDMRKVGAKRIRAEAHRVAEGEGVAYVIESGIPIPHCPTQQRVPASGPRTPLSTALCALEITQSFFIPTEREYVQVRALLARMKPKRFATRKLPREGWRVWRVA